MTTLSGLRRLAIVAELARRMADRGSWCGETHIQKSVYFLQNLLQLPLSYEFVLYKHGPYSFDLHDDIVAMKARGLLEAQIKPPYGPSFVLGPLGEGTLALFKKTCIKYGRKLDFVAAELGPKTVAELEPLATALFVTASQPPGRLVDDRPQRLVQLKPHISPPDASKAVRDLDALRLRAGAACLDTPDEPCADRLG